MNLNATSYLQKLIKTFTTKIIAITILSLIAINLTAQKVFDFKVGFNTCNLDNYANIIEQNKWQRTDDNSLAPPVEADFKNPLNKFIIEHQENMPVIVVTCNNGEVLAGLSLKAFNKAIQFNSLNGVNFSSFLLSGENNNPVDVNIEGGVSNINTLTLQNLSYLYIKNLSTINVGQLLTLEGNLSLISGKIVMQENAQFRFGFGKLEFLHPSTFIEGLANASFISYDPGGFAVKEIFFTNLGGMESGFARHFQFVNPGNINLPDATLQGRYIYLGGYGNAVTGSLMPHNIDQLTTSVNDPIHTLSLTNHISTDKLTLYGALILGDKNLAVNNKDIGNIFPFGNGMSFDFQARMIVTNGTGKMTINNFTGEAVFPLAHTDNLGKNYMPLKINNTGGPAESFTVSAADNVQFAYDQQQYKTVTTTWFIDEQTVGGNTATLTFQWDENEMEPGFVLADAKAAHFDNNNIDLLTGTPENPDDVARLFTTVGVTTFSPWTIFSPAGALPVKLVNFDAALTGNTVKLSWSTATETNNDRFDIERSTDGTSYTKVGEVKGKGNSAVKTEYTYADDVRNLTGTLYYRLKQVDIDAKSTYSPVKSVKINAGKNSASVWPNPFTDYTKINVNSNEAGTINVRIFNSDGRAVINTKYNAKKGANEFTVNGLGNLAKGMYTIEITDAKGVKEIIKLIK